MADILAGIAPQKDTYANWVSLNPTLGKDSDSKSYSQFLFATGSPVGDILIWGNNETFTVAYAAGQFVTNIYKDIINPLKITDTTESTDKDTGALIIEGGVGIEKNLNVGGGVTVPVMHVQDQKPSGTDGGTFTSGARRIRDVNTILKNTITGASLGSNQITLPAGIYRFIVKAPAYAVNHNMCWIYDTTNTTDLANSQSIHSASSGVVWNNAEIHEDIVLTGTTVIEIQHQCQTTHATGFGEQAGSFFTVPHELYTDIFIEKIG